MKKNKNVILFSLLGILLLPIVFTLFNIFNISIHPALYMIFVNIIVFATSFIAGANALEKAYIKGIEIGLIFVGAFFLLSFILKAKLTLFRLIYYLIIILVSTLGAITGINMSKNTCKK